MTTPYLRWRKQQRWRVQLLRWIEVAGYAFIVFVVAAMLFR